MRLHLPPDWDAINHIGDGDLPTAFPNNKRSAALDSKSATRPCASSARRPARGRCPERSIRLGRDPPPWRGSASRVTASWDRRAAEEPVVALMQVLPVAKAP